MIVWGVYSGRSRKLKYFPPKISIEGHGIKRGLTAVEAGILMETGGVKKADPEGAKRFFRKACALKYLESCEKLY